MKNIFIATVSVLLSTIVMATELSWVDEQIEAIKPPRKGVYISNVKNPFVFLEKNGFVKKERAVKTKQKGLIYTSSRSNTETKKIVEPIKYSKLILELIINSSAKINGTWYKKSSTINGYKIVAINKSSVTLKQGDKKLTLSTKTKNKNLKFRNK